MSPDRSRGFWQTLSVSGKMLFVAAVFSATILFQIAFSVMALDTQANGSEQVDALGRQRFLITRYYADALQSVIGDPEDYRLMRRVYEENLGALIGGGRVNVDFDTGRYVTMPAASAELAERLSAQQAAANRLFSAMDRFLAMSAAERQASLPLLDEMARIRREVATLADTTAKTLSRDLRQQVEVSIQRAIVVGLIAAVTGLVATWLVGRSITGPLGEAVGLARAITDGDLSVRAVPVRSSDEVGLLMGALNQMLVSLRSVTEETRGAADRLRREVSQIVASVQEQASSTKQQAAAVQEITSTVEEISQSAEQVSGMAREVGGAADDAVATGRFGLQAVLDTTAAMEAIRSQAESVAETVVMLSERTQAVGEIIATVNEIAEQSNLVALNAAIEAADAGEQGRRFAVVASEIKALADQAKEATKQVRSILEQTQKGINTSVMLTEEALKRVASGRDKTSSAEEAIRRMAASIQENADSFQQVAAATGQQQIGLEQIAQGLHQIRQASLQTATSTDQLARTSGELNGLADALARAMEKYRL
ncbi:methyl-accepting chemotaxis protein [Arenibaculum pallidiluteum]|uniref:methyl-accepting chemotaxis protein n=1 Tax=Arenibaculum pallidiluteum TaxID=2812559 RepID=UPI001A95E718|nr:methyl-accepting chemotaxis protein [Arenibaculum pallidiluteum]